VVLAATAAGSKSPANAPTSIKANSREAVRMLATAISPGAVILVLLLYFLPTIVATVRKVKDQGSIFVLRRPALAVETLWVLSLRRGFEIILRGAYGR
jgi:hypothetical protein